MRGRFGGPTGLCIAIAFTLLPSAPSSADDNWAPTIERVSGPAEDQYGWRQLSAGVDAARGQWLAYSGITVALRSPNIYSNGWRLRIDGGYGQYSYSASQITNFPCGPLPFAVPCARENKHYVVDHSYAEALIGYYLGLGDLTAKAFVGATMSTERHSEPDPAHKDDGTEYGAKGVIELWLNVGRRSWTSLDVSYATARNETSAHWRAGWRVKPQVSVGPELRYDKNVETGEGEWNGRAGLFARYEWIGGEVSLASGICGRVDDWSGKDTSPYGTLNVLFLY